MPGKTSRWNRLSKDARFWIKLVGALLLLYFGYDIAGRTSWFLFKAKYQKQGLSFDIEDHSETPPAEEDFFQSPTIKGWMVDPELRMAFSQQPEGLHAVLDHRYGWEKRELAPLRDLLADYDSKLNDREAAEQILSAYLGADRFYEQFVEDAKRPSAGRNGEGFAISFLITFVHNLRYRIRANLYRDNTDAAIAELVAGLRFAQHIRERRSVVFAIMSMEILGVLEDVIWEGLAKHSWNDSQLETLSSQLDQLKIARDFSEVGNYEIALAAHGLSGIRTFYWNELEDHFDQNGARTFLSSSNLKKTVRLVLKLVAPGGHHQLGMRLTQAEFWAVASFGKPGAMPGEFSIDQLRQVKSWNHDAWRHKIHHEAPSLDQTGQMILRTQQVYDFARIACELERFKLKTGTYPKSLSELKIDVPPDRFLAGGANVHYQRTGNRYQLHAAGKDETDNGGDPDLDMTWGY